MLVSCYMKENGDEYRDFVPDGMTVDQYCQAHIDPAAAEMEELSLKCAYDLLYDGAGLTLDIAYLDRSPGDRVNSHLYEPKSIDTSSAKPPMDGKVTLLYRPFVALSTFRGRRTDDEQRALRHFIPNRGKRKVAV